MPHWLYTAFLRLIRRWYDPEVARAKNERTDAAVTRGQKAIQSYERESQAYVKR